jgi:hypothetical protein
MPVVLLPDAERLVSAYLRSRAEVSGLVDDRVWTELPGVRADQTEWRFPCVRLVRVGGSPLLERPLHWDRARLQLDAWGGPKALARQIAETCRAVLAEAHLATHDGAVVAGVGFGPFAYLPDEDFTPFRPRYTFDATVTLRPGPAGS